MEPPLPSAIASISSTIDEIENAPPPPPEDGFKKDLLALLAADVAGELGAGKAGDGLFVRQLPLHAHFRLLGVVGHEASVDEEIAAMVLPQKLPSAKITFA